LDRSPESILLRIRSEENLVQRFNTYFCVASADSPEMIKTAYALRYQVYCIERQFEDPAQQFNHLESDDFDRRSIHSLLFYRPQGEAIGTARLILPLARPKSLPIQQVLQVNSLDSGDYFPDDTVAEVSRFAISKAFRRRAFETSESWPALNPTEMRSNLPFLGLVQAVLRQSIKIGVDHWAAIMEPQLLRMLAVMGINFHPIGPLISYHGLRQPSYCHIPQMLKELKRANPENWSVISNEGELAYRAVEGLASQIAIAKKFRGAISKSTPFRQPLTANPRMEIEGRRLGRR